MVYFGAAVLHLARLPGRLFTVLAHVVDAVIETLYWQWVRLTHHGATSRVILGGSLGSLGSFDAERTRHLLDSWRERVREPYDPETHLPLLRRLWVASSFPEEEFSPTSRRWTSIGFQSPEPASDFRGGGALSLKCIVYMAETYNDEYLRLSAERPVEAYYPFSASCINVSFALLDTLGIRDLHVGDGGDLVGSLASASTDGFLRRIVAYGDDDAVVHDDDDDAVDRVDHHPHHRHHRHHPVELAFFEVAVEAMIELDRVFKAEGASYMDFPRVRDVVLDRLARRMAVGRTRTRTRTRR